MHPEELEIIKRIREGDMDAFETIFRAHYQSLCLFAIRYLRRTDLAEEIVQDLFYTIWEKRAKLILDTSLKSYLFRAVHNNSLKYLQHEKVVEKYAVHLKRRDEFRYDEPAHNMQVDELVILLDRAYDAMPVKTREIFELSRNEGLKYGEIAQKLNISVKTVEAHMGNALKILREHLKEYIPVAIFILLQVFY